MTSTCKRPLSVAHNCGMSHCSIDEIAAYARQLEGMLQLVLDFHSTDAVRFVAQYGHGVGTKELCDRVRAAMGRDGE